MRIRSKSVTLERLKSVPVIDIPQKAEALMAILKASLPLRARTTPRLAALLRERSPGCKIPLACDVAEVFYAGDEGGILCALDFGDRKTTDVHIVSITHLAFDRTVRMARDIEAYQRHRTKKIRRQTGRNI